MLASQKLGQAGLTDFCARMNLPPPVTKKSFNEHLIQIEKAAVNMLRFKCKMLLGDCLQLLRIDTLIELKTCGDHSCRIHKQRGTCGNHIRRTCF